MKVLSPLLLVQSSLLDFIEDIDHDERVIQAGFMQENRDCSYSTYTCRWLSVNTRSGAGKAAHHYLQSCFRDPQGISHAFTSSKLRCHELATEIPTAPYIARRFARDSPVICHVNRRTGKRFISDAFDPELVEKLCDPRSSNNHVRMQLETFTFKRFVALEVPLTSPLVTGHLDCLMCDDERDRLYAIEIKSYPSDHTDPWAGTPRSTLFRNLVQALAYSELLADNTGCRRVAAGLLHRHGIVVLDAKEWLEAGRTLMRGVRDYLGSRLA